jgi:hypothetical protein
MTYHDALWQVRLGDDDRAHLFQGRHQNAILQSRVERSSNIAKGTVIARNIELIFQSHRYAMQRSDWASVRSKERVELTGLCDGILEQNLRKAELKSVRSPRMRRGERIATCQFVCAQR